VADDLLDLVVDFLRILEGEHSPVLPKQLDQSRPPVLEVRFWLISPVAVNLRIDLH
jgi:hypothetical protein